MNLLGMKRLPGARTLGNWLYAVGRNPLTMGALNEINRRILKARFHDCKRVPLDVNATVFEAHKKEAKWIYKEGPGFVPIVGHIAESEQVVETEVQVGNVSSNSENLGLIKRCERALPEGVSVSHVWIDSAGYQAEINNCLRASGIRFAIRAKIDSAVKESISAIKPSDWQPLIVANGSTSDQEEVVRTLHVMYESPQAFALVVQRRLIDEAGRDPQQELFREFLARWM